MPNPVIVAAHRTAVGTSFKGSLSQTEPAALATPVVRHVLDRLSAQTGLIDDLMLAESLHGGGVLARYVALEAGLRDVPGLALNRHCAGGLSAILAASGAIRSGDRVILAGGVQSSSTAPLLRQRHRPEEDWPFESHRPTPTAPADDMSITVGWNAARTAGISREEQDAWALRSHQRALAAISEGVFVNEIVPLDITAADGSRSTFAVDEHPRASTSAEKLAGLRPLHPEIDGFNITAGNASGINDAASVVAIADPEVARTQGWIPMAQIRAGASVGVDPERTGLSVGAAIQKMLNRAGLRPEDIDVWEINEAFASVPIAAVRELGLDENRVNPWGSGCSIGHPVAATGGRMVTTLSHHLARQGGGLAVAAMCAGGGMATALLLEGNA